MARPERLELPTLWFEARCSIQLSYGRAKAYYNDEIPFRDGLSANSRHWLHRRNQFRNLDADQRSLPRPAFDLQMKIAAIEHA